MNTNDFVMSGIQLKKMIEKKVEPVIEEYDLRPVELDILVLLHQEKNIDTAKAIVQRKHLSKAHISKSIDNLSERGFIQINEDETDRRILHICLTDKSQEVVERMLNIYSECKEIMERGVSAEEMEVVKNVLLKMMKNINHELGEE